MKSRHVVFAKRQCVTSAQNKRMSQSSIAMKVLEISAISVARTSALAELMIANTTSAPTVVGTTAFVQSVVARGHSRD